MSPPARAQLARANFEQFKTWSPEVNINALMIVKRASEPIEQTICRYADHEGVDLIACGSKALNPENVASCSVVDTLKTTGCSVLVSKSGIRSKNLLESSQTMGHGHAPTGRQQQGLSVSILVDEHFEDCLRFTMNFFNDKERDSLSLLRLTKRSDLPDQTLEHFRVIQRCEQLCCASQCARADGGGGGYGLVSVVNNVVTTMKDSTGNGTTEVASHVQNSEVGLLVIALPSAAGVSEFVTDILVKATCPILFVRPSGN